MAMTLIVFFLVRRLSAPFKLIQTILNVPEPKSIASKSSNRVPATRVTKLIQFLKIEGYATMYHIHGDCLFLLLDTLEKPATLSFISPF